MSFVYGLEVFDPEGLPQGLTDHDAAEHQRGLTLRRPSPKLLQFVMKVRSEIRGVSVNVSAAGEAVTLEQPLGHDPLLRGVGADQALFILSLPIEEDVSEIQEVVPQLVAWAHGLGLRTYDAQQDAFEAERIEVNALATSNLAIERQAGESETESVDLFLMDAHAFLSFGVGSIPEALRVTPGCTVAQACEMFMQGKALDKPYGAHLRRLVSRLLDFFPFDADDRAVWCGRHPLNDPVYQSDGVRLIRVAGDRLDAVLGKALPLARELFLAVAVPGQGFYVHREFRPELFRTSDQGRLAALDADWQMHRVAQDEIERRYKGALGDLLRPLGYETYDDQGPWRFAFARELSVGGGRHVISYGGSGLEARVQSDRLIRLKTSLHPSFKAIYGNVVKIDFESLRMAREPDWQGCGAATVSSDEMIRFALDDVRVMLLPLLAKLETAKDLWEWYQVDGRVPGCKTIPGFQALDWFSAFVEREPLASGLEVSFYVARYLPDAQFLGLLNDWARHMEAHPKFPTAATLYPYIEIFRQMPQTSMGAPL